MMTNGKIAAAVVGGYLLGRTGKGKLALSLGMMLAGRKLGPRDLARTVAGSPALSGLGDKVRKDLVESTKSAAGGALEARMNSLADSLHERSAELEGGSGGEEEESEPEPEREEPPARTTRKTARSARSAKSAESPTSARSRPARTTRSRAAKSTTRGGGDE